MKVRAGCLYRDSSGVCDQVSHGRRHEGQDADHEYEGPAKAGFGQKPRPALAPRSEKRQTFYRETYVPAVREAVGDGKRPCPVKAEGCTGFVEALHERASRGRFGGLPAAVEAGGTVGMCSSCNGYISTHPIWARENGWLLSNTVDGTRAAPRMPPRRQP